MDLKKLYEQKPEELNENPNLALNVVKNNLYIQYISLQNYLSFMNYLKTNTDPRKWNVF